ncbi:MAG: GntR family transcriptional regulator [Desulfobacterales bacterium]|jgi:GntR family transcriptional repressor for pyruvate dehydrogenase complex
MSSDLKTVFTPIKSPRTFEEVSNRIKKLIFDGVFKPGDKLPPEIEIAQQFNVGRQSIREALRILELSGFITIQKGGGGGAIIKDTISNTISELFLDAFQLERITIEELTIARFEIEKIVLKYTIENADKSDIESLQQNIQAAREKIENNNPAVDENIRFHKLLARASKNQLFVIVVEAVTAAIRHFLSGLGPDAESSGSEKWYNENVMNSKNTLAYHEDILNAIVAKKLDLAIDILEDHLLEVKGRLQPLARKHMSR